MTFAYFLSDLFYGGRPLWLPACQLPVRASQHWADSTLQVMMTLACCSYFFFLFILWWASLPAPCQSLTKQGWQHTTDNDDIGLLFFFLFTLWWPPACQLPVRASQHVADSMPQIKITFAYFFLIYSMVGQPASSLSEPHNTGLTACHR
jgi:hypothetical protein